MFPIIALKEQRPPPADYDWERAYKVSWDAIGRGSANPIYKKNLIVKLSREADLPIWEFMKQ